MTQRDWQDDYEMLNSYFEYGHFTNYPEQNLRGVPVTEILFYWLQEAKEREEREQRLKEAAQKVVDHKEPITYLATELSSLFPDTPAPRRANRSCITNSMNLTTL